MTVNMAQVLEDMGIAGKTFLQEALTNTTDPLGAIEEFQLENSILLPSLQPALPLLDLHDLKRLDFHQSVFEVLRDRLLNKINEISKNNDGDTKEKLEAVLDKSFPLIKIESLIPVSMRLLQHLPKVPEKYISALIKDKGLYNACPIEVKRQIWQKNQTMFGDEVLPLLTQYIKAKESNLLSGDCTGSSNFFSTLPKARRQSIIIKTLTDMIGKNVRLYDMVLQFLRTLFLKTHSVHYCSLRAEILMSLHDLEVTEICAVDPCYKFTWCLDACNREHFVDVKRARELQGFLDNVKKGHEQVLGDLSMILCDPFAVNTMLWSVLKIINETAMKEILPRDNTELRLLLRMLALGQSAWDIINKQVFKEPKVDREITTRFLPSLLAIGICENITSIQNKLKKQNNSTSDSENQNVETSKSFKKKSKKKIAKNDSNDEDRDSSMLESIFTFISKMLVKDQLSRILLMWHVLNLIKTKKKSQLIQLLPVLGKSFKECATDPVFVHAISSQLTTHSEMLSDDNFCNVVFNKLLISSKSLKDIQHRQLLGLVICVCPKLSEAKLKFLVTRLEPRSKKASEQTIELHNKLKDKVSSVEKTATSSDNNLSSPTQSNMLGVPTPAPL